MTTGPQFTSRVAARVVLLDPANRVLLFRYVEPWSRHAIWATPGGGHEPGETDAAAARREVVEETGLTDVALSPIIWTRESRRKAFKNVAGGRSRSSSELPSPSPAVPRRA